MANTYIPPQLCIGNWTIANECTLNHDAKTVENQVAESIEIAGAPINVFKLRGVHEQGKLIDLTGTGTPICSGSNTGSDILNAFDNSNTSWQSSQLGTDVTLIPGWIGYDFGPIKNNTGTSKYNTPKRINQHITTIRIQQGSLSQNRVIQARIERANGQLIQSNSFIGNGTGKLVNIQPGYFANESKILLIATSSQTFQVFSSTKGLLGLAEVNVPFASEDIRFTISIGSIPFSINDTFTINLKLDWQRVDIVNLPDTSNFETINIKPSVPSPFWRIVPLLFNGGTTDYWEIVKLEMIDYQSTNINNIQDTFFLENRDRDYATNSIVMKCQYQPFDSVGDLGKFGFSILDQYIFTCSFARMVELLGRPIVIGDILEITPELAYDQNLQPVKKYLEVTDASWSSEGYTAQWKPILYRFLANQLLPSTEHRDIISMPEDALFKVSDGTFFDTLNQVETTSTLVSQTIQADSTQVVPERGEDTQHISTHIPEPYTEKLSPVTLGIYVEDGLPPNGEPYTEGYKLPDINVATDGEYFRLNYEKNMNIPARLYKFNGIKMRWIYVETDRRNENSSHKPSVRNALVSLNKKSLQDNT